MSRCFIRKSPFGVIKNIRALGIILAAAAAFVTDFGVQAAEATAGQKIVRIGITEPQTPFDTQKAEEKTLAYLAEKLPNYKVEFVQLSNENLKAAVERERPDFLISSASSYLQVAWSLGAHRLVHKRNANVKDIQHAVASVFVVPKGAEHRTLKSYRGATVAAISRSGFSDWQIAMGELEDAGFDSSRFFGRALFAEKTGESVVDMLRKGYADIGILPSCLLEKMIERKAVAESEFVVLNEKTTDEDVCRRSTAAYPDEVFSSLPWAEPEDVKQFLSALLAMPLEVWAFEWSTAHDLNPVLHLMEKLQLPPYDDRSLKALLLRYKVEIGFILLIVLGLALHSYRADRLVARRTQELTAFMNEREALAKETAAYKEKLDNLERMGIVSYMSNLFAHEIRQPITNILFYASTLKVRIRSRQIDSDDFLSVVGKIAEQANQSNAIVKRLRNYAKNVQAPFTVVSLAAAVNEVCKGLLQGDARQKISVSLDDDLCVEGDAFEIEFVVSTFVKNALEALSGRPDGVIKISGARRQDGMIELAVRDNGPALSNERFAELGRYTKSTKAQGLGFGLAVAADIAERHHGRLEFRRRTPSGLEAVLVLPEAKNTEQKKE